MRRALLIATALFVTACVSAPRWHGAKSDHFDGKRFFDDPPASRGVGGLLKWQLTAKREPWKKWSENPPQPLPPRRVAGGVIHVTFVNHASTLVQIDGLNVLFDPVWSEKVGPFKHLGGERRHRAPGIAFDDLPPIDAVVISHNHYDHLDIPTLRRLEKAHHPKFFVPLSSAKLLAKNGIAGATDMDWWDSMSLGSGLTLVCLPARHFSGRGPFDQDRTLWAGWAIRSATGSVYFAGDTGYGKHFAEIAAKIPGIRVALLPIGSYEPRWFMEPVHMNPSDAVKAFGDLKAASAVAIHWHTFRQTDEGEERPATDLAAALDAAGIAREKFRALENGEGIDVP